MAKRAKKSRRSQSKTRRTQRRARATRTDRYYDGPAEWLLPMIEETHSRLAPKDQIDAVPNLAPARAARALRAKGVQASPEPFRSTYRSGKGEDVLAEVPRTFWRDRFAEVHRRRVAHAKKVAAMRALPPGVLAMPAIPGMNNWSPLGPSIVAHAQTGNRGPVTGRTGGIAVANDGLRMYVATADGGVWRSDDTGRHWRSTMDSFDQIGRAHV